MKKFANMLVAWGPPGLFLLTLLDSAGMPLPGVIDTLLVFLSSRSPESWMVFAAIAVTGSLIGTMFLYYISRKGGEKFLDRYTASGRGAHLKAWFLRYGLVTVFIPAISVFPITLKVPVICAGALGVRPLALAATVLTARVIRYFGLAYFGSLMGENAFAWINQHKWAIGGALLALAIVLGVLAKIADQRSYPAASKAN